MEMTLKKFDQLTREEKLNYYQVEVMPKVKWGFDEYDNLVPLNIEYFELDYGFINTTEFISFVNYFHRIKPEPEYVPFTYEDRNLFMGKEVKRKTSERSYIIVGCDKDSLLIGVNWIHYDYAFENYIFADGSPLGKIKED